MWERWDDEYEDEYYELIRLKKTADKTNDEIEVAKYINWLLEKVDFDAFDICDHSQQIVFWNEINTYIKKFKASVEAGDKEMATKLLSEVSSLVDSAASKKVIHKSNADRKKSRLSSYMAKKLG